MGFKNVSNLYGGIFEWKNQEQAVVTPNKNEATEKKFMPLQQSMGNMAKERRESLLKKRNETAALIDERSQMQSEISELFPINALILKVVASRLLTSLTK